MWVPCRQQINSLPSCALLVERTSRPDSCRRRPSPAPEEAERDRSSWRGSRCTAAWEVEILVAPSLFLPRCPCLLPHLGRPRTRRHSQGQNPRGGGCLMREVSRAVPLVSPLSSAVAGQDPPLHLEFLSSYIDPPLHLEFLSSYIVSFLDCNLLCYIPSYIVGSYISLVSLMLRHVINIWCIHPTF